MQANKLTFPLIALSLCLGACDSKKSEAEADKEAREAVNEHREAVDEAKTKTDPEDRIEALDKANEELAEDVADAYEGTPGEVDETKTAAADGDDDPKSLTDGQRFAAYESESKEEFVTRARSTIASIEADLADAKAKKAPTEDVTEVSERLAEARKDLDEVENGTTKVIDDGKLGVTVAINSARRKLDRIEQDLAEAD